MAEKPQKALQKFFAGNKKMPLYLLVLAALGAMLLMLNRLAAPPPRPSPQQYAQVYALPEIPAHAADFAYERALEQRLEEFFSMIEGAGRVRVMVSPASGRETIFHTDTNETRSYSTMQDAQGGTSESRQQSTIDTTVIVSSPGGNAPLITQEIEPRISGIAIIAEGGANPIVQEAITNAARALLGLDAHMIRVLVMN
ncbi:MAG: hypothetical protein FWC78_04190 [Defluviitaleaceae bacterium]|nr:hypothetical protein [Defluviitaleaceae bacterium]